MTKEEARRLMDLYLDEELPVELMSEFNEVLQGSPELQQEVASFRRVRQEVTRALEAPFADGQWKRRVLHRLLEHLLETPGTPATFCQRGLPLEKDTSL